MNTINFKHNWVLTDKLLLGEAPKKKEDITLLKKYKIKSILTLCDEIEFALPNDLRKFFNCQRVVLPDHKVDKTITFEELDLSINLLSNLLKEGKVYIHCYAGLERSPLICIGYLMINKNLSLTDSLEYLMSVNPGTCPLQKHIDQLEKYIKNLKNK